MKVLLDNGANVNAATGLAMVDQLTGPLPVEPLVSRS